MYRIRQQDLPLRGSSYNFVGADSGDVLVIKAGEVHSFKNIGDTPLVQLDAPQSTIHSGESRITGAGRGATFEWHRRSVDLHQAYLNARTNRGF